MTTIPVTVLNLSAALGRIVIGLIADRTGPVNALIFVTLMSGLSQLLLWTLVSTYAGVVSSFKYPFVIPALPRPV